MLGMTLVVSIVNASRTQNGHIRNATRDVSRRSPNPSSGPICSRNCAADDRACTRVMLPNFHGKEGVDGSSPSEGLQDARKSAPCVQADLQVQPRAVGMEPFMEL
jgi:hypothetical protein